MKNYLLITFVVLLTANVAQSQSGWFSQSGNTTNNLNSVYFLDSYTGFTAGNGGIILKTTDGGRYWNPVSSGISSNLIAIHFTSVSNGIACGNSGVILGTTNTGNNWTTISGGTSNNLNSISFSDVNNGWICGIGGVILKTINGGINWTQQISGLSTDLNSIYFFDSQNGWCGGASGKMLKTINGGSTWLSAFDLGPLCTINSVRFSSISSGIALGYFATTPTPFSFVYKTIDAGNLWLFYQPNTTANLKTFFSKNNSYYWIAGDSGKIFLSYNSGINWAYSPSIYTERINALYFAEGNTGWAVGNNGTILKSIHSGGYDTLPTNRRDLAVVSLVVDNSAIISAKYRVVFQAPDTSYNICRSVNNGVTFDTVFSHVNIRDTAYKTVNGIKVKVQKIRYTAESPGLYRGNYGVIRDPVLSPDSIQTKNYGWEYIPPGNIFLKGSKLLIEVTKPWHSKSMSLSYPSKNTYLDVTSTVLPEGLRKIKIIFGASGQKAYYYKDTLTNYGYRIFKYSGIKDVPFRVYECDYTDSSSDDRQLNFGFVESSEVTGYFTNQFNFYSDSLGGKQVLYFFYSSYDTSVALYKTTDLFMNQKFFDIQYVWSPQLISPSGHFTEGDVFYIYPYTVTRPNIVSGYPLYYEFQSLPYVGVTGVSQNIPDKYYLSQNYPNPFNPATVIRFQLPAAEQVSLKIYDILGKEIAILFDGRLQPGEYQYRFDTRNYNISSGIYFYILTSGDYTETRKMILLK